MKKMLVCLLCLLTVCGMAAPAFAADARVFDGAGLFTAPQCEALETLIAQKTAETGCDFVIVTTDDAQGKSARDYADDFYDAGGFGAAKGGVLLLIDLDNRTAYLSTDGEAIDRLTDARIESVLDEIFWYLPDGDYYGAAQAFVGAAAGWIEAGVEDGQHRYDEDTGEITYYQSGPSLGEILFYLAAAMGLSGVCVFFTARSYNKPAPSNLYPFAQKSSLHAGAQQAEQIDHHVGQRIIATPSGGSSGGFRGDSSAGRSTTHTSFGGHTHGGGGRRF